MLTTRIGNMFKKLFSRKYKTVPTTYTDNTLTSWDGVTMSRYTEKGRLTAKELKWLSTYHSTGSDIRRRGMWRISQKQLKHLFTVEQLDEHVEFNKSLSFAYKRESLSTIAKTWEKLLFAHCECNKIGYPSNVVKVKPTTDTDMLLAELEVTGSSEVAPSLEELMMSLDDADLDTAIADLLGEDALLLRGDSM